jgi:hypothetical protein
VAVQELPTVVPEFCPGLVELYGALHYDDEVPLLPVGLDVFYELHPEASIKFHSTMQNSHFHHALENILTVLRKDSKTQALLNFPS